MIVTLGASGALTLILAGLIEPADRVLVTDPAIYATASSLRQAVEVPLEAAKRYQLSEDKLAHFWDARTRAPILASPANPTGTVTSRDALISIANFCPLARRRIHRRRDLSWIDLWRARAYCLSEDVFVINSFSKSFSMTGWRLGRLVSPRCSIDALDQLARFFWRFRTVAQPQRCPKARFRSMPIAAS